LQYSLPGYTLFQTNSKRDLQNSDKILKHQFQTHRDKGYRQKPLLRQREREERFMKKKHAPMKFEDLDSVEKSVKLTPSARRNMNLETMEAGKDIVKVDDVKQDEGEQEFIQLSIEKSKESPKKEEKSIQWSVKNYVGNKRNSDHLKESIKEPEIVEKSVSVKKSLGSNKESTFKEKDDLEEIKEKENEEEEEGEEENEKEEENEDEDDEENEKEEEKEKMKGSTQELKKAEVTEKPLENVIKDDIMSLKKIKRGRLVNFKIWFRVLIHKQRR
jgi:hypothetical protein